MLVATEYDFLRLVDSLSKINNKKIYEQKSRDLTEKAFTKSNSFYPYRLALELDGRGYSVSDLEDYIIKIAGRSKFNLKYLILFPLNLLGANINKLQNAVIETKNAELMAEFSSVPGSNKLLLENLIIDLKVPKASYMFLCLNKKFKSEEHKKILLKSKKSRYLYKCATMATSKEEFEVVEDLLLKNKSNYYIRLISSLKFANHQKIENRIINSLDFEEIKKLYKITKSPRLAKYVVIM